MILIGEVGGSSTEWRVIEDSVIRQFKTIGVNLIHDSVSSFLKKVHKSIAPYTHADQVFMYFAGLVDVKSRRRSVINEIQKVFPTSKIEIENDLLAAARGALQERSGWVGILGTGANFAFYNGRFIDQRIATLGYILGDEGSGAYMGKKLLTDFGRNRLPADIENKFRRAYKMDEPTLLAKVYDPTGAKSFLAGFTPFLHQHMDHSYCKQLVYQSFLDHFNAMAVNYDLSSSVSYTGSIAFNFSNLLIEAAKIMRITIGTITATPIEGLVTFHNTKI